MTLKRREIRPSIFTFVHIPQHICSGSRVRRCDGRNFIIFHLPSLYCFLFSLPQVLVGSDNVVNIVIFPRRLVLFILTKIRSGEIRFILLIVLFLDRIYASAGYTRCSGCTSVCLCSAAMQNLAVQQDFYSPFCVPLERAC